MPKHALIVEDDEPTQKLLETLLRRSGLATTIAPTGTDAIERLSSVTFDVVILDLMMPYVAGEDVIAFLAARDPRPPVIVCTAAGPKATAGLDPSVVKGLVRKPFDILELSDLVEKLTRSVQTPSEDA